MLIDDEAALQEWLVATLEPMCDAEPKALARYVLALVTKDKPLDRLRENCIDRLDVFLDRATKDFVDQLFDVIRTRRYIPEAKKENVQPKATDSSDEKSGEAAESLEAQNLSTSDRQESEDQVQNSSNINVSTSSEPATTVQQNSPGAIVQPVKRRYPSYRSTPGRHHSPNSRRHINASTGGATRHQNSSHYRPSTTSNPSNQRSLRSSSRSRSVSPPPAKRTQRSYSHSSSGSSSRSSPSRQNTPIHPVSSSNTDFLYNQNPCSDFFENKSYRALGDSGSYDDGNSTAVFERAQQPPYYPPYPQYGMPPAHMHPHYHEYNPENPDLKRGPRPPPPMFLRHPPPMHHHPRMLGPPMPGVPPNPQPVGQPPLMMNPQRTLVTVVTNAEPLPLELRMRPNEPMGVPNNPNLPMMHQKRHGPNAPYQNDRRSQQHESSSGHESQNNQNTSNNNHNNNHHNSNNGYNNRGWKRPWQKPDGSNATPATLEIRKIPVEFNTISKLNEHFSKFGTVTNVQIAYDGSQDSALVAYATHSEAETAYKNPQPLFNNRFIKIFWHNSNKNQGPGNNNNQSNHGQSQATQQNQQSSASATNNDNSNSKKPSGNVTNPKKLHWIKTQQQSNNKNDAVPTTQQPSNVPGVATTAITTSTTITTTTSATTTPNPATSAPVIPASKKPASSSTNIAKKDAAKKTAMEIHRKKQGLLEEQIQQQKLLLKKFETAETTTEKESIRSLMKQIDATIVTLKDSLRITASNKSTVPSPTPTLPKTAPTSNLSQQDVLKQRAASLRKEIEKLRAKTSADMRRGLSNTLGQNFVQLATSSSNIESKLKENRDETEQDNSQQLMIRNIKDLPRSDLEEFLKKSGAKHIQSIDNSDGDLLVTMNSLSDIEKIKKDGLTFGENSLNISFQEESSLNTSGRKRTLSETLEDELLGAASTEPTNDDPDQEDYEPDAKRPNQSQTSDSEENAEHDEEDRLLADEGNQTKNSRSSIPVDDESNSPNENQSNVIDNNELQLLDL